MKDIYKTYSLSVSFDIQGAYVSIDWEENFSREEIKDFFDPEHNMYNEIIVLPELFTPEDEENLTDQEKYTIEQQAQSQIEDFQFSVISEDCFNIWLEDLSKIYNANKSRSNYEKRFTEIISSHFHDKDKEAMVLQLYALVKEMEE